MVELKQVDASQHQLEDIFFTRLNFEIIESWLTVEVQPAPINVHGTRDRKTLQVQAILYTYVVGSNVLGHFGRTVIEFSNSEHHSKPILEAIKLFTNHPPMLA